MPVATIDISTPADAGFWREALAWVGFRVADFERGDDVARERADALAPEPSVPFIHDGEVARD